MLTAADLDAAHYHSISHPHPIPGRGGKLPVSPHRPALAEKRVMHVGEPVAMVVAQSAAAAQDAAEKIASTTRNSTPSPRCAQPSRPARRSYGRKRPAISVSTGQRRPIRTARSKPRSSRAFAEAAHVVRVELVNQRLVVASLEPRTATASYDAETEDASRCAAARKVWPACAARWRARMNIKPEELRVVTDDLGGAFGMKGWCYPEYVAMLHAARSSSGRSTGCRRARKPSSPTTRAATRSGARSWRSTKRGKFLGLRVDCLGNVGAYHHRRGAFRLHHAHLRLPADGLRHPARAGERALRLTNTLPTGPYRGAGRPEASYLIERLIDAAADQTGIDAAELRRRNLIAPDANSLHDRLRQHLRQRRLSRDLRARADGSPTTPVLPRARRRRRKQGRLRGIGIGCYLEIAGAFPEEAARIAFPGGDKVTVSIGAGGSGQGHPTVFRRVAARRLGIAPRNGDAAVRRLGARRAGLRRGRLALGHVCRRRHRGHRRQSDREGQEGRRAAAAGGGGRRRISRRQVPREGRASCRCSRWPSVPPSSRSRA